MIRHPRLHGRTVLVTGAAGGIGQALARLLTLEERSRLILVDRDGDGLGRLAEDLGRRGAEVALHAVDLRDRSAIEALAATVAAGPLDVLINNAGVVFGRSFAATSAEEIDTTLAVNLVAPLHLTRLLLPRIVEARGFIVNVASAGGLAGAAGMAAYAASKFGVVGFSEALRAELRGQGVGVSAICPAFVRTDLLRNSAASLGSDGAAARTEALDRLVQRLGVTPEEVARAAIASIKRDRGIVVVGLPSRLLLALRARFPGAAARLNQAIFDRLRAEGLIA